MDLFKINKSMNVVCRSEKTRSGFRHIAELYLNGSAIEKATASYVNRTWERFTYQSVIIKLIEKSERLTQRQKTLFLKKIK